MKTLNFALIALLTSIAICQSATSTSNPGTTPQPPTPVSDETTLCAFQIERIRRSAKKIMETPAAKSTTTTPQKGMLSKLYETEKANALIAVKVCSSVYTGQKTSLSSTCIKLIEPVTKALTDMKNRVEKSKNLLIEAKSKFDAELKKPEKDQRPNQNTMEILGTNGKQFFAGNREFFGLYATWKGAFEELFKKEASIVKECKL